MENNYPGRFFRTGDINFRLRCMGETDEALNLLIMRGVIDREMIGGVDEIISAPAAAAAERFKAKADGTVNKYL